MSPSRILIVNQNWLGDVLFSTPAIRAIRKKYPDAYLCCLIPERCRPILKRNPHLNELIVYNDRANWLKPADLWRTVMRLRAKQFDQAIFFHRSKTKRCLAGLAGIRQCHPFEAPPAGVHKIDHFLNLISKLSIVPEGRHLEFYPDPSAEDELKQLMLENGVSPGSPYGVVHAGGNWALKRWPQEHFVEWIRLFLQERRIKVILCGTESERQTADHIASSFSEKDVVSFCGKTSLDMLAVLLKKAQFLLSNDSGPIHLAATQNTKTIGLFGPTSWAVTGPVSDAPMKILQKDVGCEVPCYYSSCDDHACMKFLTPKEVFDASQAL